MSKCDRCGCEADMRTQTQRSEFQAFVGVVVLLVGAPVVLLGLCGAAEGYVGALILPGLLGGALCCLGLRAIRSSRYNHKCPSCYHKWYADEDG